jgi:hypothetical protein
VLFLLGVLLIVASITGFGTLYVDCAESKNKDCSDIDYIFLNFILLLLGIALVAKEFF